MIYTFDKRQKLIGVYDEKKEVTVAKLTLKINEAATLDLSLPASKENIARMKNVVFLAVPYPNDENKLLFLRVMTRTDEEYTIELMAKEFAYQELATSGYIEDRRFNDADARTLINGAVSGSGYSVQNVNVSGTAQLNFYYEDYLSSISDVIEALGGEVVFYVTVTGNQISGRYIDYVLAQGTNTSKTFAYGSNLISVERQSDASEVYTAILPRGKGEQVSEGTNSAPDGYGRRINIADVVWKKPTNKLNKPAGSLVLEDPSATAAFGQANGTARLLLKTYDNIEDKNELIEAAYRDLMKYNHPAAQFTASVANIGDSALGDTIVIMHSDRDMSYRTRIFQIEYDLIELGNTTATFGDNLSQKNISSMISNVSKAVDNAKEIATNAVVSANSINNNYYGETAPVNPKDGDTWFYTDGDVFGIRRYINGQWVEYTNTNTTKKIADQVDAAISNAKEYSDNLNQKQANATNSLANELIVKANSLSAGQQKIASQATSYTDSAVADANAKAVQIGQTTAQNAQKALEEKSTTLQQSIDTKVAKTDYDKKTGELTTSVNTAQQTANTATQTIGTYKQTNDKRVSAAETNIKANSDAIALTVSKTDFDKATGKLSGDISTLQQRADGFEATVTKVNNLDVGGRNLLLGTSNSFTGIGNNSTNGNFDAQGGKYSLSGSKKVSDLYNQYGKTGYLTLSFDWVASGSTISGQFFPQWNNTPWRGGFDGKAVNISSANASGRYECTVPLSNAGYSTGTADGIAFRQDNLQGNVTISNVKLEAGNVVTDWTPAPEDVDTQLAQVKITADGVYQTVNDPKTGLNTRVSTAEGNINTIKSNIDGMSNTVTRTANGLTQEISDRQTGDSNTLQAGKDFTTSQIKSYDTGMQTQISQVSDGILATVATTNLVIDSSLISQLDNWRYGRGSKKWYYSGAASYKGVNSIGFNSTGNAGAYNEIFSQPIDVNSFSGNVLYVSIDLRLPHIGGTSTDYLIVYLLEEDATGKVIKYNSISGKLSSEFSNWTNYRSKITLDTTTTKVYLSYQFRGDGNAYISRPYVGTTELPAGGYTPGTPNNNTTVLSLLKDNWKIGIADNIGLITSGIVGDSNSINLISQNVTIDSPNTQIKGTAWITNAMLGNASVSTANIGDLAVTSAKISELDVNKLSGNITNFIKSYWSNAYQNLQIDASAIDFTTSNSRTKIENGSITMWQNAGGYYRLGGVKAMKSLAGGENNHTAGIYLALDEWQTTNNGDKYWNYGGPDFFGGSEIGILHSTGVDSSGNPIYGALMKWSNDLAAGRQSGITKGFNFFDDINFQGRQILVNGAANKMKFTWISWSDWGNYHNIALTNETAKAGIAMNNDNLVLFGVGKRADAQTGWNA